MINGINRLIKYHFTKWGNYMKLYLAGYDVFRKDAKQYGEKLKKLCKQYGAIGLYPLDNEGDNAEDIFKGNLHLLEQCDAVIANLNFFRGDDMDSGTAFEIGYAFARGKRIWGYLQDARPLKEKLGKCDCNGFMVENFQLPLNLMIACSAQIVEGDFLTCLSQCIETEKVIRE